MRLTLAGKSALLAFLAVVLLVGPVMADPEGDAMGRPDQLRGVKNNDTPTSVDPYEEPAFNDELEPSRDESMPGDLNALVNERGEGGGDQTKKAATKMRFDAMREAAMSYGARGGLSRRTWEIRQTLDKSAGELDRTYNFGVLLISAPSGFLIEPPIVTEAQQNVIVSGDGQEAAVTDSIIKIGREARIVTAAREWRTYLERDWGKVSPPPDVLLPRTEAERLEWAKWVQQGWEAGYKQADEIFQSDLDRLSRDYTGMVRYRALLSQNMISAPYALQEDRGVTGGGGEMRIGDRAVSITGQSQLQARPERWQPVPR
jgi:defect-in-organelle-trafficking protein DotC